MLQHTLYRSVTVFDTLVVLLLFFLSFLLIRMGSFIVRRHLKETVSQDHLQVLLKVVRFGTLILMLLIALPLLGVDLSGLLVAGGLAGVVIGFASQSVVSNLISGLFLMFERPIKIGQAVNIDGTAGVVDDIRIMSTVLRTYEGLFVRIPNIQVFSGTLINYVANVARRFEYKIGIRYMDDANLAIQTIKEIVDMEPMALNNPAPQVFVDTLGDNSVDLFIRIWAPAGEWWDLKMVLLNNLKIALEAKGIEIPFPQRVLWHQDGQELTKKTATKQGV